MFIGHYAAGLALRKADPRIPLGWFILAACWLDIVFGFLLVAGIEKVRIVPGITAANSLDLYHYPFSHGLTAALLWSGIAYVVFRYILFYQSINKSRVAVLMTIAVFSHWILDWISHRPDLPLGWTDSRVFGLGLWNSIPATISIESLLFIGGFYLYLQSSPGGTRLWNIGITILAITLLLINFFSIGSEPPPNPDAIGYVNLIGGLTIIGLFAYLDKKRFKSKVLNPGNIG